MGESQRAKCASVQGGIFFVAHYIAITHCNTISRCEMQTQTAGYNHIILTLPRSRSTLVEHLLLGLTPLAFTRRWFSVICLELEGSIAAALLPLLLGLGAELLRLPCTSPVMVCELCVPVVVHDGDSAGSASLLQMFEAASLLLLLLVML